VIVHPKIKWVIIYTPSFYLKLIILVSSMKGKKTNKKKTQEP